MKYHSLTRLFAIGLSTITLFSCTSENPAFSVNTLQLGTGISSGFTAEALDIAVTDLPNAGDSTAISVNVVDQNGLPSTDSVTVTFSSTCITSGASSLNNTSVVNSTGTVSVTYTNLSCNNDDTVVATTDTSPVLSATGIISTGTSAAVTPAPTTAGTDLLLGSFSGVTFSNQIALGSSTIVPGGNTTLTVNIVDSANNNILATEAATVSFSSNCQSAGTATISPLSAVNSTGSIQATYTDLDTGCTTDTIFATTTFTGASTSSSALAAITITSTPVVVPTSSIQIGNGIGAGFTNGLINVLSPSIATASSSDLRVNLVDANNNLVTAANSVTFSALCDNNGTVTIAPTNVSSSTGVFLTTITDTSCIGNVDITATLDGTSNTASGLLNVVSTASTGTLSIGSGLGGNFVNNALNVQIDSINTGGTTTISANIVDSSGIPDSASHTVSFIYQCDNGGTGTLSNTSVTGTSGLFTTDFTDVSCNGNVDILASALLNGNSLTASGSLTVVTTASTGTLSLGNGIGSGFTDTRLNVSPSTISTGESSTITANIVDESGIRDTNSHTVTFDYQCDNGGAGTLPAIPANTTGTFSTTFTDTSCDGNVDITANTLLNGVSTTASGSLTVVATTTSTTYSIGSGIGAGFTNGILNIQDTNLSTGESTSITANIVDENHSLVLAANTVSFSALCSNNGTFTILPSPITNATGVYTTTFTDTTCNGTVDIVASATLNGVTTTASNALTVGTTPTTDTYSIGNGVGSGFTSGELNIQSTNITPTGSTTVTANIVNADNILDTVNSNTVTFTAQCDNFGTFTLLPAAVTNATGVYSATFTDTSCNGSIDIVAYATLNGVTKTAYGSLLVGTTPPDETYSIGDLLTTGTFVAGNMNISNAALAAGESSIIIVNVADSSGNLYTAVPTDIIFNSTCVAQGTATILTSNGSAEIDTGTTGTATATYQALGCVGDDTITATAAGLNATTTATGTINVGAAAFNTIEFVSALPSQIGIQGMGYNETTNVTFKLVDESSGPFANQLVTFTLSNEAGGISLTNLTATSGSNGEVTAVVQSGKVQANFVVTATTTVGATTYVSSSNTISVQDAIPAQNGMSLVAGTLNPEGYNLVQNVPITVYVNDRNNNPVPDGNQVNFLAECGSIDASCPIVNGSCSVTWTTTPIQGTCLDYDAGVDDTDLGKVSILAYIDGEESFLDANANGDYDAGETILANNQEAFMDFDNDGAFTAANDAYQDFNGNGSHDDAATLDGNAAPRFNGALCVTNCGTTDRIHVYKTTTLIASTSGSTITFDVTDISAAPATTTIFNVKAVDNNGNIMPAGTEVSISASKGTIDSNTTFTIGNGAPLSLASIDSASTFPVVYSSSPTGDEGLITVEVASPGGTSTFAYLSIATPTYIIGDVTATAGNLTIADNAFTIGNTESTLITAYISANGVLDSTNEHTVTYTATCAGDLDLSNNFSSTSITNSTGIYSTTLTDASCTGNISITASVLLNGDASPSTATGTITVTP